ncbi:bifunctional heptose 7-phosphate kinase/heptose 1-phosphate adenyltransferase [Skermania sp. ID1734]|uniref:PfkB family carbohydrate kinase n=1 Tax=Skermania sp. ID1734 TaxID=2597516 RepID=UPI00117D05C9|nr:PfkB family carbohydrate kinase [Skermania sp. ID1734]TSD99457.1 bifunctional heptose 7-phosphate kinase/heptose 1-phosphate adenyltransferase [Skermania sp. ID1734]
MTGPLVVIGDALLDTDVLGRAERLCPEAPVPVVDVSGERQRPGGAGLAATIAAHTGAEVWLVCALGTDSAGRRLGELLRDQLQVIGLPLAGSTVCKTRVRAGDQSIVRLDSGDGHAVHGPAPESVAELLSRAATILVSDYGRGVAAHPQLRGLIADAAQRIPVVWDPHPRGSAPVPGTRLVTPNRKEAEQFCPSRTDVTELAPTLGQLWRSDAVAVTLGSAGASLWTAGRGGSVHISAPTLDGFGANAIDTCGAGDCFASSAALELLAGGSVTQAISLATRHASEFVRGGGASTHGVLCDHSGLPTHSEFASDAIEFAERIRTSGGRLVATGGCFDLLHPGHVSLLRQARAMGDGLVVCLNSDASVRRAKGDGRPVVRAEDRAKVLLELASVDAVAIFDEPTPARLLEHLRPNVWVKGQDWASPHTASRYDQLPEAATVHRHGGRVVFVPVLRGYSTTRIVAAARATA